MSAVRLSNLLGAATVALSDRLQAEVSDVVGVGGEAPAAIVTIGTRPGRSIEHLRTTIGLSHSGAVRLVDRLEEHGCVARERSEGRSVQLTLTDRGDAVFQRILKARRVLLGQVLGPLDAGRRRALEDALGVVLENLADGREDAWRICRLCEHAVCQEQACPVGRGAALDHHGGGAESSPTVHEGT